MLGDSSSPLALPAANSLGRPQKEPKPAPNRTQRARVGVNEGPSAAVSWLSSLGVGAERGAYVATSLTPKEPLQYSTPNPLRKGTDGVATGIAAAGLGSNRDGEDVRAHFLLQLSAGKEAYEGSYGRSWCFQRASVMMCCTLTRVSRVELFKGR